MQKFFTNIGSTATKHDSCKTQFGLAQLAIKERRVKLAENDYGTWIVMENWKMMIYNRDRPGNL